MDFVVTSAIPTAIPTGFHCCLELCRSLTTRENVLCVSSSQQLKSVGIAVGVANSPAIPTENMVDNAVGNAKCSWVLLWV